MTREEFDMMDDSEAMEYIRDMENSNELLRRRGDRFAAAIHAAIRKHGATCDMSDLELSFDCGIERGGAGSVPETRRDLVWHPGPANGGGGTAQDELAGTKRSWWWDGELLLIVVELQSGYIVRLVHVDADGTYLSFRDPDTDDDIGYGPESISWWAKIEESLPHNSVVARHPETSN